MANTQNIGDIIRALAREEMEVYSKPCKVISIDSDLMELEPLDGDANLLDVKLIAGENNFPLKITPVIDSIVLATFLSKDTAFISLYSEVETIELRGDQYGGLIKIEELVDKINRLESKVNDLVKTFNTHTHITTATVSATPVPGVITPPTAPETPITPITTVKDLENEAIKHG